MAGDDRRKQLVAAAAGGALLVALTAVIYAQVRGFAFLNFDDPFYITNNPHTQRGLTWDNLLWALGSGAAANWHPLTWLSHMLDVSLFGTNAGMHHLTNVVFHSANAVLLFLILRSMTGDHWPSLFVAALFAVHPLHVESVAWVAERKDVLSMFLLLLTVAVYARKPPARRIGPATVILFTLGLMAKPMLVSLPFLLLFLDHWPLRRGEPLRSRLWEKAPLFLLSFASCVVTFVAQRQGGAVIPMEHLPALERLGNALVSYVTYLAKMVWPSGLAPLYPIVREDIRLWKALAALLLVGAITVGAVRNRREKPYLLAGWLWYLVSLLPVIGLVQVGSQALADRYTYIPLVGPFLIVAWGGRDLGRYLRLPSWAAMAGAWAAALALLMVARTQASYWRDSVTLFRRERAVATDNIVARTNLGHGLLLQGRPQEAIPEFRAAIAMNPASRQPRVDLAKALSEAGQTEEAVAVYEAWMRDTPTDFAALADLASLLTRVGRLEEAIPAYKGYLDLEPLRLKDDPDLRREMGRSQEARMRLGLIERKLGREARALVWFQEAARVSPRSPEITLNLGVSLAALGRVEEAREMFNRTLAMQPGSEEAKARLAALKP